LRKKARSIPTRPHGYFLAGAAASVVPAGAFAFASGLSHPRVASRQTFPASPVAQHQQTSRHDPITARSASSGAAPSTRSPLMNRVGVASTPKLVAFSQ